MASCTLEAFKAASALCARQMPAVSGSLSPNLSPERRPSTAHTIYSALLSTSSTIGKVSDDEIVPATASSSAPTTPELEWATPQSPPPSHLNARRSSSSSGIDYGGSSSRHTFTADRESQSRRIVGNPLLDMHERRPEGPSASSEISLGVPMPTAVSCFLARVKRLLTKSSGIAGASSFLRRRRPKRSPPPVPQAVTPAHSEGLRRHRSGTYTSRGALSSTSGVLRRSVTVSDGGSAAVFSTKGGFICCMYLPRS